MKRTLLTIAMLIVLTQSAFAEPLTDKEKTKQSIFHGLSAADAITTIVGVGKGLVETNGILGAAPEPITVVTFFVARSVIHEYVTPMIDEKLRPYWQNTWIGVAGLAVINNLVLISKY